SAPRACGRAGARRRRASALPRARRARTVRAVGTARAALARAAAVAALLALVVARLLLAEALDAHAAALAVRHQPGALRPAAFRRLLPLVASAAIMPAQRRVVLPPGIAAARPARRLFLALVMPAMAPALVTAARTIAALEIVAFAITPRTALLAAAPL